MRAPAVLHARLVALVVFLTTGTAAAVKVQVRAATQLEARASLHDDGLRIRGHVNDDTGRPVAGARLRVRASRARGAGSLAPGRVVGCSGFAASAIHASREEVLVEADGGGAFCVVLGDLDRRAVLTVTFDGDRFHEASVLHVDGDASRRPLDLSFSPTPSVLPLERETHVVGLDARVEPADEVRSEPLQLRLLLEDKDGSRRELGRAATRSGERAELLLKSKDLGSPGPATLIAEFAGSDTVQPARRAVPVQRTARVGLSVAGPVAPADPSSGLELDVAVGSALGAVPSGSVEIVVGGESVGTAPVRDGVAHVVAVFPLPAAGTVLVALRYLPEAPWWVAGEPITLSVPVAPPSLWRRWPWVLAAVAVGAWVVRAWWRPPRTEKIPRDRVSLPPGRPSLELIEVGPADAGWRGRVVDAHEGTAIEGATLAIVLPTFAADGVVARVASTEQGRFELPPVPRVEGARLRVSAPWHSTLVRDLPSPGHLQVSLVSRRRALLDRLVEWAVRRGAPWTVPGDPTPAHVAAVARARQADDVATWAREVERAAFGAEPPDAETEERICEQEPAWRGGDDSGR